MKIVYLIARILLGLVFLVFGLNGFLHFLPNPPLPTGPAGQFVVALSESHYMIVVFVVQLIGAIGLLLNQYVPLALTLLGPVVVNIILFHAFMAPSGLPMAMITAILWVVAAHQVRSSFAGLLQQRVPTDNFD